MTSLLMRRLALAPLSFAVVASTVVALDLSGTAGAAVPSARTAPVVAVPTSSSLGSVSQAPKSSDAWAVGHFSTAKGNGVIVSHRHSGHWTNSTFSLPVNSSITNVAALSSSQAWVTGYYETKTFAQVPLLDRTVGRKLAKVKVPFGAGSLGAISASSAKNVWILGTKVVSGTPTQVAMHWNGKKWTLPKLPKGFSATAISTSSSSNTWALGSFQNPKTFVSFETAAHWNGHKWSLSTYRVAAGKAYPNSIATASKRSTFVSGYTYLGKTPTQRNYIAHWNGRKWSTMKVPSKAQSTLSSVTAIGGDAWAVGTVTGGKVTVPVILHFSGGKWRTQPAPTPGFGAALTSVSASSASHATAVGSYQINKVQCGPSRGFNAMYNGHSWSSGASPAANFRTRSHLRAEPGSGGGLGC